MTEFLENGDGTKGDLTIPEDGDDADKQEDADAKRREEYNRKLMDFRRDELVLNEESDGDDDG